MNLLSLFRKPHTDDTELRDRALIAETRAAVLENALEAERRRRFRQRRSDAIDVALAIAAQRKAYEERFAALTPEQAQAARMRGMGGGR